MHTSKGDPHARIHGVVQVAHGMGAHIGHYGELIGALTAAGFAVYGHDHRGHGRTARSPKPLAISATALTY
jgi:alpha-beta hydrolase superfamily lysophospholipase